MPSSSGKVLTRADDEPTFMETFPKRWAVRHEARWSGASVPPAAECSLATRLGGPGILGGPSCSKARICGPAATGLQPGRPPGPLGILETARCLTAGR